MNVIVMVSDGYPIRFSANNTKGEFVALGLKHSGCKVSILDEIYGTKGIDKAIEGVSDTGLDYLLLPRIGRVTAPLRTIPVIWNYLKCKKEKGGKNHIIIGMKMYPLYVIVCIMAMLQGYSRSSLFHEWHISFGSGNKSVLSESWWKDYTFGYLLNGIFPIGRYLENKARRFRKPMMLLPILGSYERTHKCIAEERFFTYCCGAGYLLRNKLVINAFVSLLKNNHYKDVKLVLVLIGIMEEIDSVKELILLYGLEDNIIIRNGLSQKELYNLFDSSIGLLIPLDPDCLQDKARFSQKIAEYVASRRPIITSEVGEIPYYFKNKESAIIVPFSESGYCEGMRLLLDNPSLADMVGQKGYEVGCDFFDYKKVGLKMKKFIEQL